jgi:hypothetical protein
MPPTLSRTGALKAMTILIAAASLAACKESSDSLDAMAPPATGVEQSETAAPAIPAPPAPSPAGLLANEEMLRADTVVAARYGGIEAGTSLLGVWAAAEPDCESVDQADDIVFAVITPSSVRDANSRCTAALTAGNTGTTVAATCMEGGRSEEREILIESQGPDKLLYRPQPEEEPLSLVRCQLPR